MKELAWLANDITASEIKSILFGLSYDDPSHEYTVGYGDDCLTIVRTN